MPRSLFKGLAQLLTAQPMERLLQAATMRLLRLRGAVAVSGLWGESDSLSCWTAHCALLPTRCRHAMESRSAKEMKTHGTPDSVWCPLADHLVLDMLSEGALLARSRGDFEAEWEAAAGEPRSRPIMSELASVMQWNPDTETIKK